MSSASLYWVARLLFLCTLTGAPGYLALRFFARQSQKFSLTLWLFLIAAFGLVLVGLVGIALAVMGCFTSLAIIASIGFLSLLLYFFGGAGKSFLIVPQISRRDILSLALIVAALAIFLPPHENFVVGRDPGVYTNTAIHLARTGRWVIEDPFFIALPEATQKAFSFYVWKKGPFRMPGFFWEPERGIVLSQFLPFFTVWMALSEKFVGPGCGPWVTPVFMVLGALGLVNVAARFWPPGAGILFLLLFMCHPAIIWYARSANSEVALLVILLLLILLWAECWTREREWRILVLVGAALLAGFLDKLDMIYYGAFFLLVVAGTQIVFPKFYTNVGLGLALLVAVVLASVYMGFLSLPYLKLSFDFLAANVFLRYSLILLVFSLLVLLLIHFWGDRFSLLLLVRERASAFRGLSRKQMGWLALIGVCLFVVAYWLLPLTVSDGLISDRRLSLAKLGWYVNPAGFLLAGIGCFSLFFERELSAEALLFAGFFAVSFVLNLAAPMTDHIFALRRFMAFPFPVLLLTAAAGLVFVSRWRPQGVSWVGTLVSLLLGGLMTFTQLSHAPMIVTHQEFDGAREMLQRLGEQIDPETVAVFYEKDSLLGTFFGTNLWLEHDVVSLYAFTSLSLADWQSVRQMAGIQNRSMVAVGTAPPRILPDVDWIASQRFSWHLPELERTYEHYPNQINSFDFEFILWQLAAGAGQIVYQPDVLFTQVGSLTKVNGQELLLGQGEKGYLSHGPYHVFPPGRYTARYTLLNLSSTESQVVLDVVPWSMSPISELPVHIKAGETVSLDLPFAVADGAETLALEFRVFLPDGGAVGLTKLTIIPSNE